MRVRWTAPAAEDLCQIALYIRRENPTAAREVATTLYDGCESLKNTPYRGRKGRMEGIRELVFPGLPYIAVYRVKSPIVEIMHIDHGARKRP